MTRLGYFLRRALKGMRQAAFVNGLAVLTIAIALFVVAVFAGVLGQVRGLIDAWGDDLAVTVYLSPEVTDAQRDAVLSAVREAAGEGADVRRVGREEAMARLSVSLGEHADILQGLDRNPLPESVEIRAAPALKGPAALERFAAGISAVAGVDEVDYGREWAERLERLLDLVGLAGFGLGGLILLAAAVMVSNTIKLAVFARRDEIEIMKLCGATDAFVRAPFLIEGVLQGLLGAAVAGAAGALVWVLAIPELEAALTETFAVAVRTRVPWDHLAWLFAGGTALGLGGSALSLGRFLKV